MISFLKKLWVDFTSTKSYPGYWTSSADMPVFVYGGDPLSTVVIFNSGNNELVEIDHKDTNSVIKQS